MRRARTLLKVFRTFGPREVLHLVYRKIFKRRETPFNGNWWDNCSYKFVDVDAFPKEIEITSQEAKEFKKEYQEIVFSNEKRKGFFNSQYDLGYYAGLILYSLVRKIKPQGILETGVAAGRSSLIALNAIERNGKGKLTSIDVTHKVGELIPEYLKAFWSLHVLRSPREVELKKFLNDLDICDFYLHDSDHSLEWQMAEFAAVTNSFPKLKVILFDDPDLQLLENVSESGWKVFLIKDEGKCSALLLS